jgi:pimeloyl-ACP methyl ester carboxylesterase
MKRSHFLTLCLSLLLAGQIPLRAEISFPDAKVDTWHGYKRHSFKVNGQDAWLVEPNTPTAEKYWSWCMEFPDAFTQRCAAPALLEKGFYHVHIKVGNTFGAPAALDHFDAFYTTLTKAGLHKRTILIGLSRGGLYAYRWAARDAPRVSVIYGDAPVCDFKSWPGGKGKGKGSPGDWASLQKLYGFKDEAEAVASKINPVDQLEPLAKANVALIHVVGDADNVVPAEENTTLIETRYKALGGKVEVINKPGIGHHPHGLDDPTPVVKFILDNCKAKVP